MVVDQGVESEPVLPGLREGPETGGGSARQVVELATCMAMVKESAALVANQMKEQMKEQTEKMAREMSSERVAEARELWAEMKTVVEQRDQLIRRLENEREKLSDDLRKMQNLGHERETVLEQRDLQIRRLENERVKLSEDLRKMQNLRQKREQCDPDSVVDEHVVDGESSGSEDEFSGSGTSSDEEEGGERLKRRLVAYEGRRDAGNHRWKLCEVDTAIEYWERAEACLKVVLRRDLLHMDHATMETIKGGMSALHLNLAQAFLKCGEYKMAARAAGKALAFDLLNIKALYRMCVAWKGCGKYTKARGWIARFQKVCPESASAKQMLLEIDRLEKSQVR